MDTFKCHYRNRIQNIERVYGKYITIVYFFKLFVIKRHKETVFQPRH